MIRTPFLLATVVLSLRAVEPVVRDASLEFELRPLSYEYTYVAPRINHHEEDDFDTALAIVVGGRYGFGSPGVPHGLVLGAHFVAGESEAKDILTYSTYGGRATVAYAYALTDSITVMAESLVEYGWGGIDFEQTPAYSAFSVDGSYITMGAQARGSYAFSDHWAVSLGVGYLHSSAALEDDTVDLTLDQDGLMVGLGLVWRISARPSVLW